MQDFARHYGCSVLPARPRLPQDKAKVESAVQVVELLRADGYEVAHFDPLVKGMAYPGSLAAACAGADCLVLLVEHTVVMAELAAQRPEIDRNMRTAQVLRF